MIRKYLRPIGAALLVMLGVGAALALNVPSTAVFSARQNTTQQTNYYRFVVNFNDPRISTGVKFGRLPSNAFISKIACEGLAAFNAATTNEFTVGYTAADPTEIIGANDYDETSASGGLQVVAWNAGGTTGRGLGTRTTSAGEVDLIAKYAQTGTAATTGKVNCVIEYIPNNDQ